MNRRRYTAEHIVWALCGGIVLSAALVGIMVRL